jgi:hypothetical protein
VSDHLIIKAPATPRTFARMVRAAIVSDLGDRSFRNHVHGDVQDQPSWLMLTDDQHRELEATARPEHIRTTDSGVTVYCDIPCLVVHDGAEQTRVYSEVLDLRDLRAPDGSLRWE